MMVRSVEGLPNALPGDVPAEGAVRFAELAGSHGAGTVGGPCSEPSGRAVKEGPVVLVLRDEDEGGGYIP